MVAKVTFKRSLLDFSESYSRAHDLADELAGTKQEIKARKQKLHQEIGIADYSDAWRSNIRAIGESAAWMRKHAKHLPQSTESLTLIAHETEAKLVRLIKKEMLDETSSITETRAAFGTLTAVTVTYRNTYDATLSFKNKSDAVEWFVHGLRNSTGTLLVRDKSVKAAIKQALGQADWDRFQSRLA